MHVLDAVDAATLRKDVPSFRPGDEIKVHVRVIEGNKSRIQVFQGLVIRRSGSGARETFTIRKISYGVGVERTFPARAAITEVAATVVAAWRPCAARIGRSRTEALLTSEELAISTNSASDSPTQTSPLMSAIVAGTAPCSRTQSSICRATSKFVGRGRPWLMMVDSRATTPILSSNAFCTSSENFTLLRYQTKYSTNG